MASRVADTHRGAVLWSMARSLSFSAAWLALALALLSSACGPTGADARVSVRGTREGNALAAGCVDMGSNICISQALLRPARVTVSSGSGMLTRDTPINLNLFNDTLIMQGSLAGSLSEVVMELSAPEGDGVLPGEAISVFAAGSIEGVWFEYRDVAMEPLLIEAEGELAEGTTLEVELELDLQTWLDGIETGQLVLGSKPSGEPCYFIDESRNATAQAQIEQSIRDSLSAESEEVEVED